MGGEKATEGAGDWEREWTELSAGGELGRLRPGVHGEGYRALLHQKEKKRRKEQGGALKDFPSEAQEAEEPQSREDPCWQIKDKLRTGETEEIGWTLRSGNVEKNSHNCFGKQSDIKKQEIQNLWWGVGAQLRLDAGTLQGACSCPSPRTSLTVLKATQCRPLPSAVGYGHT